MAREGESVRETVSGNLEGEEEVLESWLSGPIGPGSEWMLLATMALIGIFHTMVPDHWVPITLVARRYRWSRKETGRFAALAGLGHVLTTLLLGLLVWGIGKAAALRFGQALDSYASFGLVLFGGWFAVRSYREVRASGTEDASQHHHSHGYDHVHGLVLFSEPDLGSDHEHGHDHDHNHDHPHPPVSSDAAAKNVASEEWAKKDALYRPEKEGVSITHIHAHRHDPEGEPHAHFHDHGEGSAHPLRASLDRHPPVHSHRHKMAFRTYLLLLLGASPMVEGIPLFFAAGKMGGGTITRMSAVFAASTILTYVLLCTASAATMQKVSFGPLERYGEVVSGLFIAIVGTVFWFFPVF